MPMYLSVLRNSKPKLFLLPELPFESPISVARSKLMQLG